MADRLPLGQFRNDLVPFETLALMQQYGSNTLAQAVSEVVGATVRVTSKQMAELARIIDQGLMPDRFLAAHQEVGVKAQQSVVHSYRATRSQGGPRGYRARDRYSGGRLLGALESPEFFSATSEGLEFINVELLNRRAAQWARLNFGAAPAGEGSNKQFSVQMSNMVVATLGFDEPARPSFWIPKGYFWSGSAPVRPGAGSKDEFHLAGTGPRKGTTRVRGHDGERSFNALMKPRKSQGIEARHFLDVGLRRIAHEIGPAYKEVLDDAWKAGISNVRPAAITQKVRTSTIRR